MNKKELEKIAKIHEGQTIEFKENLSKEIKKEICAFTNSQGGKIYLGISDKEELKPLNITNSFIDFQIRCAIFKGNNKTYIIDSKEYSGNLIKKEWSNKTGGVM